MLHNSEFLVTYHSGSLLTPEQTIVANAPVIHGLYRHGVKHIRNRRYRSDSCNLNRNDATDTAEGTAGERPTGAAKRTVGDPSLTAFHRP